MADVVWTRRGWKELRKIPQKKDRIAIVDAVDELAEEPQKPNLDVKKLTDNKDDEYRLRVGNYRVIYTVESGKPKILKIKNVERRNSKTY